MSIMKAEDLMIGDWVHWQNRAIDPDIWLDSPIRELQGDHCHLEYGGGDPFDYDEIEPIPLTPEILEKNGFIRDGESWWYKDFRVVLESSKGVSLVCGRQVKFSYIHQLQHTIRLCGIENEIVL